MEKVHISLVAVKKNMESGKKEKEIDGLEEVSLIDLFFVIIKLNKRISLAF